MFLVFYSNLMYFRFDLRRREVSRGLLMRTSLFDPTPVRVRFVVDEVRLEQVFLPVLRFFPVTITPTTLYTHLWFTYRRRCVDLALDSVFEYNAKINIRLIYDISL